MAQILSPKERTKKITRRNGGGIDRSVADLTPGQKRPTKSKAFPAKQAIQFQRVQDPKTTQHVGSGAGAGLGPIPRSLSFSFAVVNLL
jgi:hypothetical protein